MNDIIIITGVNQFERIPSKVIAELANDWTAKPNHDMINSFLSMHSTQEQEN